MRTMLPSNYVDHPATLEDVDAVVAMSNACARQQVGVDKFSPEDTRSEWQTPGFNLETDTRLVLTRDGEIVGYYEVWDPDEPHAVIFCWGRVHPAHTSQGIGTYLLEWAERRARQSVPLAPGEARVILSGSFLSSNEAARQLFEQAGFGLVRYSLRMTISLDGKPPAPKWPRGIQVRPLVVNQEERQVYEACHEAFRDHWGYVERPVEEDFERWHYATSHAKDFDPSLWFLAVDGEEIAGVSLCHPKVNDDPEMGWVGTLCVRRPWRRRGLALALLHHSFAEFYRRGLRKVGLGVDAENLTGALRLYYRAGMQPDPARQYSIFEKELHPGKDLRTLSVSS